MTSVVERSEQMEGPALSVEFFPPKTPAGEEQLARCLDQLRDVDLAFVSVTYGAGGSTRNTTRDLVVEMNRDLPYPAMAHLTCVGHTRDELVDLLEDYDRSGVHNILALGGDPPKDGSPAEGDFEYALELVELVRAQGDHFTVAVAAHPELPPRSPDRRSDREHLAAKLAAADLGVTQFTFDAAHYTRMMDELSDLGVDTPVHPGLMPLSNPAGVRRMAAMAGAAVPEDLVAAVEATEDADERFDMVVEATTELARRLLDAGAPGLHLYGLNRAEVVLALDQELRGG